MYVCSPFRLQELAETLHLTEIAEDFIYSVALLLARSQIDFIRKFPDQFTLDDTEGARLMHGFRLANLNLYSSSSPLSNPPSPVKTSNDNTNTNETETDASPNVHEHPKNDGNNHDDDDDDDDPGPNENEDEVVASSLPSPEASGKKKNVSKKKVIIRKKN